MRIAVSACLLGVNCRYCGESNLNEKIAELLKEHELIPLCPEQLGGLPTPREPNEILNGRVMDKSGKDNTEAFLRGAEETLRIMKFLNCKHAILKERSPSCGSGKIYDGTFSRKVIDGSGFTASLLMKNGIKVANEENFDSLISEGS